MRRQDAAGDRSMVTGNQGNEAATKEAIEDTHQLGNQAIKDTHQSRSNQEQSNQGHPSIKKQ
jgi:hypothetical protein